MLHINNTNFSKIKIIGFDLDQTLYPKSPLIDEAIQGYLFEEISLLKKISKDEAKKIFDSYYKNGKGLSGSKTLIQIGFGENRAKNLVQEALENADISEFLKPNKDILSILKYLKNKYSSLDIITGSNKKNTLIKLDKLKINTSLFKNILTSDNASKSDLDAYKIWMSYYPNLLPENFLYIGDRPSTDYEKPKDLGIKSILVNIKEFDPSINCLQLKSLIEIKEYL